MVDPHGLFDERLFRAAAAQGANQISTEPTIDCGQIPTTSTRLTALLPSDHNNNYLHSVCTVKYRSCYNHIGGFYGFLTP